MKARSGGLLAILVMCGLAVSCGGDDDDDQLQEAGGNAGLGGAASGSPGKGGSAGTAAAGGSGKGGAHQGARGGNGGTDESGRAGTNEGGNAGTDQSGKAGTSEGGNAGGGEGGKAGSDEGGNAGGGEVGGDVDMRRARCEALCSIVPTGYGFETGNEDPPGAPCGNYDDCLESLCTVNAGYESECLAAQDALYPCLLEQDPDKFYCYNQHLAIDFAAYYFCNDAFSVWGNYCGGR